MKLVLLFNLFVQTSYSQTLISSDRFLIKIVDRTISQQDILFQVRNLRALKCIFSDAIILQYFGKSFLEKIDKFSKGIPKDQASGEYFQKNEEVLKEIRYFFKMLRYTEDQKAKVSSQLESLVRESAQEFGCETEILYKETLKTNFKNLLELELYLRARYGEQLKANKNKFDAIRTSVDLFIDSLDKQFNHEYYW